MREFKADDVILEVIVSRAGMEEGAEGSRPGSIEPLPEDRERREGGGGGGREGKIRKIYLKRRKSAVGHFAVRRSISTERVCMFLAGSRAAVSLHMTTLLLLFFSRKILCVFTDFSKRMPFRTAVELQRSIYCRR